VKPMKPRGRPPGQHTPCAVPGCERRAVARGLCHAHYMRKRRAEFDGATMGAEIMAPIRPPGPSGEAEVFLGLTVPALVRRGIRARADALGQSMSGICRPVLAKLASGGETDKFPPAAWIRLRGAVEERVDFLRSLYGERTELPGEAEHAKAKRREADTLAEDIVALAAYLGRESK